MKSIVLFVSFLFFCRLELNIVNDHPYYSVFYAIPYFIIIFFSFISTYITGMSVFEDAISTSKCSYTLELWKKVHYHYLSFAVFVAITYILSLNVSINGVIWMVILSFLSLYLSCYSAFE